MMKYCQNIIRQMAGTADVRRWKFVNQNTLNLMLKKRGEKEKLPLPKSVRTVRIDWKFSVSIQGKKRSYFHRNILTGKRKWADVVKEKLLLSNFVFLSRLIPTINNINTYKRLN